MDKKSIKRGDVIGPVDNPPNAAREFEAQIIIIHHPTAMAPGYTPALHSYIASCGCLCLNLSRKSIQKPVEPVEEKPEVSKDW